MDRENSEVVYLDMGCEFGPAAPTCSTWMPDPTGKYGNAGEAYEHTARLRLIGQGYDFDAYRFVFFVYPDSDCPYSAAASVGGGASWYNGYSLDWGVVVHELGHNFGFGHEPHTQLNTANGTYTWNDLKGPSQCCDHVSRMSAGSACFNLPELFWLGWQEPKSITLEGFRAGSTVVASIEDYTSSNAVKARNAGYQLESLTSDGRDLFVGYFTNMTENLEVDSDQALRLQIWLSGKRVSIPWNGSLRVARLLPGEYFTYEDWTIIFHTRSDDMKRAITSICHGSSTSPCSKTAQQKLNPWGGTAEVGVVYSGATVDGPITAWDADTCGKLCLSKSSTCGAWSLDGNKGQCWLKSAQGWTKSSKNGWVSGTYTTAPPSPPPPLPPPPPPVMPTDAAFYQYKWAEFFNGRLGVAKVASAAACAKLCEGKKTIWVLLCVWCMYRLSIAHAVFQLRK